MIGLTFDFRPDMKGEGLASNFKAFYLEFFMVIIVFKYFESK